MNFLCTGAAKSYTELDRWLHLALLWLDSLADLLSRKKI